MLMVMMPTRPKNINTMRSSFGSVVSVAVSPAVSPTVASAETVSYRAVERLHPLHAQISAAPTNASVSISMNSVMA